MDYMDSIGFEKPKYKKGCFNITINGDKGLDDSLPALDAVVFEKKEPEVKEEKKKKFMTSRKMPKITGILATK